MKPTENQRPPRGGIFREESFLIAAAILVLGLTGCSMLRFPGSQPKAQVGSFTMTNGPSGPVSVPVLQQQVMRFADTYVATIAQACDDISTQATNPAVRLVTLRWKLSQATSAYTDATGQNPAVNALDILVLTTMSRMVVEGYGKDTYGDVILPLLNAQCSLETNAWQLASSVLKPSQQRELRAMIAEWRAQNPHQRYIGPIRFREFISALGKTPTPATTAPTSIFSLLYLDPLAGLDPTAAAIQETRELGERAMYYTQRMPMLMSWQVEVLAYQLAGQPESRQLLNDADRLAAAAESFAQLGQGFPQLVNDQRQAAIQQIFDALADQGNKSRELLVETRSTVEAASSAATNLNTAIRSLTEFVRYVSPTNDRTAVITTNGHPFNVLDYGTAATQIGVAATNLETLLASLNQTGPQIKKLGQQTKADADEVLRHAFLYALALVAILLAGLVAAALIYRFLLNKLAKAGWK